MRTTKRKTPKAVYFWPWIVPAEFGTLAYGLGIKTARVVYGPGGLGLAGRYRAWRKLTGEAVRVSITPAGVEVLRAGCTCTNDVCPPSCPACVLRPVCVRVRP